MNRIANWHWLTVIMLLFAISLASYCGGGSSPSSGGSSSSGGAAPPPDPPGTVTSNLWTSGSGPNTLNLETGNVANCCPGGADIALDSAVNFNGDLGGGNKRRTMITDVGRVSGLADVSSIPTTGWTKTAAAMTGHGYVIVSDDGNAFGIYVDSFILSATTGGIIGVKIKWVLLRNGIRIAPAGVTATPGPGRATISWQNILGATSYNLYIGGGCYSSLSGWYCTQIPCGRGLAETGVTSPYSKTGLASCVYSFGVSAVYPFGESDVTYTGNITVP